MTEFKVIETQEELDAIIKARLERERAKVNDDSNKQIEELKKQIQALENEKQSAVKSIEDLKNKNSEIETLQKQIAGYEKTELKRKIAFEKGIPYNLADRIQGEDEEAMTKDAESLSEYFKETKVAPLKNLEPEIETGIDGAYKNLLNNLGGN